MFPIKITKILGNFCCPEGLVQTGAPLVVSGWLPHSERPFVDAVSGKFCGHRCPRPFVAWKLSYIHKLLSIYHLFSWGMNIHKQRSQASAATRWRGLCPGLRPRLWRHRRPTCCDLGSQGVHHSSHSLTHSDPNMFIICLHIM